MDLALNNLQRLICHKTKPNQTNQIELLALSNRITSVYEQYLTSPRGNSFRNSSYTATYQPLRKVSKLDEPDMSDIGGEVKTSS